MPSMLLFLDISGGELAIIALVIFIILGPDKLPEMARKFGKAMRFVRKATEDIKREINIDEDLFQKPRSYSHTKKTAPINKVQEAENTNDITETTVSESKDNKSEI